MRSEKKGGGSHRVQRVERQIREAIGSYLISGFRGELPGVVTVSRVISSADLRTAKIFITMMSLGDEEQFAARQAALAELKAHTGEIQSEVNRRLQMKFCPRLSFFYDEGYESALKVENILRDLQQQREHPDVSTPPHDGSESESDD